MGVLLGQPNVASTNSSIPLDGHTAGVGRRTGRGPSASTNSLIPLDGLASVRPFANGRRILQRSLRSLSMDMPLLALSNYVTYALQRSLLLDAERWKRRHTSTKSPIPLDGHEHREPEEARVLLASTNSSTPLDGHPRSGTPSRRPCPRFNELFDLSMSTYVPVLEGEQGLLQRILRSISTRTRPLRDVASTNSPIPLDGHRMSEGREGCR